MTRRPMLRILLLSFAVTLGFLSGSEGLSQTPAGTPALAQLSPPAYPPLAREARISGDVKIALEICRDGSVASVEVVSGHPMLKDAALQSARNSQFDCSRCIAKTTSLTLTYAFGFSTDADCRVVNESRPVRSTKCLYLWKCGEHNISVIRYEDHPIQVTQAHDHIGVLASSVCWQPESSVANSVR